MVRSRTCRMEMWSGTSFVEIGACSCQETSEMQSQYVIRTLRYKSHQLRYHAHRPSLSIPLACSAIS